MRSTAQRADPSRGQEDAKVSPALEASASFPNGHESASPEFDEERLLAIRRRNKEAFASAMSYSKKGVSFLIVTTPEGDFVAVLIGRDAERDHNYAEKQGLVSTGGTLAVTTTTTRPKGGFLSRWTGTRHVAVIVEVARPLIERSHRGQFLQEIELAAEPAAVELIWSSV
jgi:hypothetical protein